MRSLLCLLGLLVSLNAFAATISVPSTDPTALQAALERAQPGDEVRLPPGTIKLTETLKPGTGTSLVGAGQARTTLLCGGEKAKVLISLAGVHEVTISDLTLDGGTDFAASRGFAAYNAQRLTISRVTVRNLSAPGAIGFHGNGQAKTYKEGVLDSRIEDCTFENIAPDNPWGAGVRFSWGSSGNTVQNCRISNTGRGGIFGDNRSNALIIRNNTITGSHGEKLGIEVWGGCDRCVIEDNKLDHWLSIGGCDYCAVRRNVIACTTPDCYAGFGLEAIGSFLVFTDNTVDGHQCLGLSVSANVRKQYHYYGNNAFLHCSQWAAQLQGETPGFQYAYFYRCQFSQTTTGVGKLWYPGFEGHGFRLNGDCQYLTCEECQMCGNGRLGVQLGGARVDALDFVRCTIRDNKGAAVEGPRDYTALEWQDCTITGNANNAVAPAKPFVTPPPTAGFEVGGEPRVGQKLRFRSTARPGQGDIERVLWDLGDGPALTGNEVRWTYGKPGKVQVTQIVWDTAGRAARSSQTLAVR